MTDDPCGPLESHIERLALHMRHHRLPLDDCDPITCTCRGVPCSLTAGDLRAAVAEIKRLREVVDRLSGMPD